jgi:hypothetical protein
MLDCLLRTRRRSRGERPVERLRPAVSVILATFYAYVGIIGSLARLTADVLQIPLDLVDDLVQFRRFQEIVRHTSLSSTTLKL